MATSEALRRWETERRRALDELEALRAGRWRDSRGGRAMRQIHRAYAILLVAQFQGFCRDLHTEAVEHVVRTLPTMWLEEVIRERLMESRLLDRGNPNPGNLGADFGRFGMALWDHVGRADRRSPGRRARLDRMNAWRNAIVHEDFDATRLGGKTSLGRAEVRSWRAACSALALSFDRALWKHLARSTGVAPW